MNMQAVKEINDDRSWTMARRETGAPPSLEPHAEQQLQEGEARQAGRGQKRRGMQHGRTSAVRFV